MNPDGTNVRDLGLPTGGNECATWSPDSSKLAFCHHGGDGNWAVWTVNADGSDPRQLTHPTLTLPRGSGGDSPGPWSPDGKRLSYYSGTARDLFVINADGTHARRILRWPAATARTPGCRAASSSSHTGRTTKPGTQTGIRSAPTAPGCKRCPGCVAPATHSTGSRLADPRPAPDRKDIDCQPCSPVMGERGSDSAGRGGGSRRDDRGRRVEELASSTTWWPGGASGSR